MRFDKNEIRIINKRIRSSLLPVDVAERSVKASEIFLSSDFYTDSSCLMLYKQLGNETDTSLIIKCAFEDGKKLVFPVTDITTGEITPFFAGCNTSFRKGNFSVSEPVGTEIADPLKIDIVLVPGIAFDKSGSRVGFGKGCYDGFLRKTNAVKIGFCYSFQICDSINCDDYDMPMDYLICEDGIIKCK